MARNQWVLALVAGYALYVVGVALVSRIAGLVPYCRRLDRRFSARPMRGDADGTEAPPALRFA